MIRNCEYTALVNDVCFEYNRSNIFSKKKSPLTTYTSYDASFPLQESHDMASSLLITSEMGSTLVAVTVEHKPCACTIYNDAIS